jgi:hypothetical protein
LKRCFFFYIEFTHGFFMQSQKTESVLKCQVQTRKWSHHTLSRKATWICRDESRDGKRQRSKQESLCTGTSKHRFARANRKTAYDRDQNRNFFELSRPNMNFPTPQAPIMPFFTIFFGTNGNCTIKKVPAPRPVRHAAARRGERLLLYSRYCIKLQDWAVEVFRRVLTIPFVSIQPLVYIHMYVIVTTIK